MQQPMPQMPLEIYVNPVKGDDTAPGNSMSPLKTLTHALRQATAGVVIQLSRGTYSTDSGEVFPLILPQGVVVLGNVPLQGSGVVIQGSGSYRSATFGLQNVAMVLQDAAELRGVTVTNLAPKGTGVWIESTAPTVAGCTLANCSREGMLVTGTANPSITNCVFQENGGSGLTLVRNAKGEIRSNLWQKNGFGVAISDRAAPIVISNQIVENRCGIVLSGMAAPILRGNLFAQNTEDGLAVFGHANPDLGKQFDPGGNRFQNNQRFDLRNATATALVASGNRINPARINGSVELVTISSPPTQFAASAPARSERSSERLPEPAPSHAPADLKLHWAASLIQPLLDRRVLPAPEGHFHPESTLTAIEFAHWMQSVLGVSSQPEGADALTRLQAVTALVAALNLPPGHPGVLKRFRDRAQIPSAQTGAIAAAVQQRLLVSTSPDSLNLLHLITQAEAAAMLYQALVSRGAATVLDLPQIVSPELISRLSTQPTFAERPPVIVLDPGHGGSDFGMTTQVEEEAEIMQEVPFEMMSSNLPMSPLPAGAMPPGMSFEMPPGMQMPPGMPPGVQMPPGMQMSSGMPPGMQMMPSGMPPGAPANSAPPLSGSSSEMPSLEEKTIVLSVAQAVAGFLQQQGLQVFLTRTDDRDLTAAERVALAEQHQANALISIHANASLANRSDINGIETYYNPSSQEGARLSWAIHKALTRTPDVVDRGVHPATFYLLRQPTMAAAQIEIGYITGSKDAPSLANSAYHRYLGRAIANGILRYVRQQA